eukprot:TRINITY_DN17631_c0_g1_i2.p1 TRINITY_DN17631_c0_g1~~TRINITY_DN17631_c0_g1_i2.p1  ORF type:complete len:305 (+),score=49.85 TRINITY_DN17631_c0_g1_i2:42-956(+)
MEKYRKFADQGTGIQPFITPKPTINYFGIPLLLVRLPLLLVFGALIAVVDLLCVIPGVVTLLFKPILGLLLFVLGYYKFEVKVWPLTAAGSEGIQLDRKTILLTNLSSYLDILVLGYLHAPRFLFATEKGAVSLSTLQALKYVGSSFGDQMRYFESAEPLEKVLQKVNRNCVLFFEGTTTTGQGVLDPPTGLLTSGIAKEYTFRLQTLSHQRKSDAFTSCYPFRSHFLSFLTTPSSTVRICTVTPKLTPQYSSVPDPPLLMRSLLSKLSEASGIRLMSSNRESKAGFTEFWGATQGVEYLKQNK